MQVVPVMCPVCGGHYDPLRSRAVKVVDGRVRAFCSAACKERGLAPVELKLEEWPSDEPHTPSGGWRRMSVPAAGLTLGIVGVLFLLLNKTAPRATLAIMSTAQAAQKSSAPQNAAEAMKLMSTSEDDRDLWYHPVAGVHRRMPEGQSRRFGANRDGARPEECRAGHCGVDLGRNKGEAVIAVHDGVVERVERDPEVGGRRGNEGRFIRVNHKGGTVVSSYMHLDGVRADLKPGIPVRAGEAIGTVGDTGVHHSGPHLHFAISIRPSQDGPELFIDPEPMLHLWPTKKHAIATLHAMQPGPARPKKTAQAAANSEEM